MPELFIRYRDKEEVVFCGKRHLGFPVNGLKNGYTVFVNVEDENHLHLNPNNLQLAEDKG